MRFLTLLWLLALLTPCWGQTPSPSPSPSPTKKIAPPKLVPTSLLVPLGERRVAHWTGGAEQVQATLSNPAVAQVDLQGRSLTVTGLTPGNTEVTLDFGEKTLVLPIKVRARAARFPSQLDLSLTGDNLGLEELREGLEQVLVDKAGLDARARLHLSVANATTLDLSQGQTLAVQLGANGPDLLPASANLTLHLARPEVNLYPAEVLALSNRPEKITQTGWLFDRALPPGKPVRVLYHHRNLPGEPDRFLEVLLHNNSEANARVHVVLASVGPSDDEIYVGHIAARSFVQRATRRQGVYVTVPAGHSVVLDRLDLKPGQTVSGMALLTPLESADIRLQVRSCSETEPFLDQPVADDTGPVRTARGLYPPAIEASYSHLVGGRYTYINLGEKPYLKDAETGEQGLGNFGVLYRIRLVLKNMQADPQDVQLGFQARGGPARGLFFVDGQLIEVGMAGQNPLPVAKWTLEPGETRQVYVECFPQSGSNYPCSLVVSSAYKGQDQVPPPTGSADPAPELPRYIP